MLKQCTKCGEWKEEEEFAFRNKAQNIRHNTCKVCKREYNKAQYVNSPELRQKTKERNKKQETLLKDYIEQIKNDGCCAICGDSRPYVLDFHHIRDKSFNIAEAPNKKISLTTLQKELDKCIIVCANCHRELHYKETHSV